MNRKDRPSRRQRGAALLLLLVILAVSGGSLLMTVFSPAAAETRREQKTQLMLARARESLLGFAMLHGRLPRPAVSATDGRETAIACDSEASCSGFIPWLALGIEPTDAWGKLLRYSVTPEYTRQPVQSQTALASKTVLTRDGGGQLRYLVGGDTCSLQLQCSPCIVFSSGRRNFGSGPDGQQFPNIEQNNVDEQTNQLAQNRFILRQPSADPASVGGSFDDQLSWITLPLLYNRMNAVGQLP